MTYWTDTPPTWQPTETEYYASAAVGSTALSHFAEDRQAWNRDRDKPRKMTAAVLRGSLLDCMVTQPDKVDSRFMLNAPGLSQAIAWGYVQGGGTLVSKEIMEQCRVAWSALNSNANVYRLLGELPGISQPCHRWTHPSGIECRFRLDRTILTAKGPTVVELKNWEIEQDRVSATINQRRTYRQAALYCQGFQDLWGVVPHYVLVIVPPSGAWVTTTPLSPEILEIGRLDVDADLYAMAECLRTGDWSNPKDLEMEYVYPSGWVKRESEQRHGGRR